MILGLNNTNINISSNVEENLNNAIFAWIEVPLNANCLYINNFKEIDFEQTDEGVYDYIFAREILEVAPKPVNLLVYLKKLLKPNGVLYLGTENRLGLCYFCGDSELGTGKPFNGLEGYAGINQSREWLQYRLYSKYEIDNFLKNAGMQNAKYYSVLPALNCAQLIYAENYLPEESLSTRYMPMYREPDKIFIREEWLYDSIINNNLFHKLANSYLIEYHSDGGNTDIIHVTLSADRGIENACATVIYEDYVEKKRLFSDLTECFEILLSNDIDLKNHGVPMVKSKLVDGKYQMPRIKAQILECFMRNTLLKDVNEFLQIFDRYRDIVYHSSDVIELNEHGPIMKKCYFDLVPLNCFYINGEFLFFDQEFYLENAPANLILWRAIVIIYDGNPTLQKILPIERLWERYGIEKHVSEYDNTASSFLKKLRNQDTLKMFNVKHLRNIAHVKENKRKMECELTDWELYKENAKETCFDDLEQKEIYVFGSGRYAEEFVCMYRYDYQIRVVLDNNIEKQSTKFYGMDIVSPDFLYGKNPETYKVIICVKDCMNIIRQLKDIGVRYIGVFDINYFYPGRQKYLPGKAGINAYQRFYIEKFEDRNNKKKYHVGYVAGVFDLYHIGHLNIFRRAKEFCDYLIVGVVSDEGVRNNKKREVYIPFEERIEMVRSCKYVDEAVEIPFKYCRTPEAFRKYHFDVQFSGSDYENDPGWLAMKDYLEEHGSTMVFFPYTAHTSSSKIKLLIDQKLL